MIFITGKFEKHWSKTLLIVIKSYSSWGGNEGEEERKQARLMNQKHTLMEFRELEYEREELTEQLELNLASILPTACSRPHVTPPPRLLHSYSLYCRQDFAWRLPDLKQQMESKGGREASQVQADTVQSLDRRGDWMACYQPSQNLNSSHLPKLDSLFIKPASLTAAGPYSTPFLFCHINHTVRCERSGLEIRPLYFAKIQKSAILYLVANRSLWKPVTPSALPFIFFTWGRLVSNTCRGGAKKITGIKSTSKPLTVGRASRGQDREGP